jgi:hypothetical protein
MLMKWHFLQDLLLKLCPKTFVRCYHSILLTQHVSKLPMENLNLPEQPRRKMRC